MRFALLCLPLAWSVAGCGSNVDVRARQAADGSCTGAPSLSRGPGEACTSPQNCSETCCRCKSPSTKSFLAQGCAEGLCGTAEEVCQAASDRDGSLCAPDPE